MHLKGLFQYPSGSYALFATVDTIPCTGRAQIQGDTNDFKRFILRYAEFTS